MKISINWLCDYIDTDLSAEQIAETLSDLGLPNEGIEYTGDDTIIDVEVTTNRSDCLSFIGIARELAAATGKPLKMPAFELPESANDVTQFASVEILEPESITEEMQNLNGILNDLAAKLHQYDATVKMLRAEVALLNKKISKKDNPDAVKPAADVKK